MNVEKPSKFENPHQGDDPDPARPVLTQALDAAQPHGIPFHRHFRAQLLYATRGVMSVETRHGTWVVPPQQAVWLPAGLEHAVRSEGPLAMRSLYIHPVKVATLPTACCVVNVPTLVRELIVKLVEMGDAVSSTAAGRRLVAVLLDQLAELSPAPLHLPLPTDPRVRSVALRLIGNPADSRGLDSLALNAGASGRTLARRFRRETGMSFGAWRRQVRLMAAISRLGAGESVTTVAYALGYQSPSAFVAMFRRTLGTPPARYLRGGTSGPGGELE